MSGSVILGRDSTWFFQRGANKTERERKREKEREREIETERERERRDKTRLRIISGHRLSALRGHRKKIGSFHWGVFPFSYLFIFPKLNCCNQPQQQARERRIYRWTLVHFELVDLCSIGCNCSPPSWLFGCSFRKMLANLFFKDWFIQLKLTCSLNWSNQRQSSSPLSLLSFSRTKWVGFSNQTVLRCFLGYWKTEKVSVASSFRQQANV